METKTIKQILSNLPDEVRDMAILNVILACGRETLDQKLCYSCGGDSPEVSALLGCTDLNRAIGGIDFWTNQILNLRKDSRKIIHVKSNQIGYLLFLNGMSTSDVLATLLEDVTLYTQPRENTIQVLIEEKHLNTLKNIGVKVDFSAKYTGENIFWN